MEKKKVFKRMIPFIIKNLGTFISAVICILIQVAISIILAQAEKGIADSAVEENIERMKWYLMVVVIITVCSLTFESVKTYMLGRFSENCILDIRMKTFSDINKLPVSYLDNHESGDLVSRINNDIGLIYNFFQGTLAGVIAVPLIVIVSSIFLFKISWKLALFTLISVPVLFILNSLISSLSQKYIDKYQIQLGKVNSVAQNSLSNIAITKSFLLEDTLGEKYTSAVDESVKSGLKVARYIALSSPFGVTMNILPMIFMFGCGGYFVVKGEMTFGDLIAFIQLALTILSPLSNIPGFINSVRSGVAGIKRITEIWDEEKERDNGDKYEDKNEFTLSFDNVSFGYDKNKKVIDGLSFNISKGEKVAIVGRSGCGKSTIIKLILGFYNSQGGTINVFGHSIDKWKLYDMRKRISLISQDNFLFYESVYNNIANGNLSAKEEEIKSAAKLADIHNFIEGLPNKYDTIIGENGAKLSGGQKQKLAIARAIIKEAPILLIDEATSALDTESESVIQKSFDSLMKNKTVLIIAHRLSTIKNVDRILVIDDGKIVEEGTHKELIERGELYSRLYSKQIVGEVLINV